MKPNARRKAKRTVLPVCVLVRETGLSRQSIWRLRKAGATDADIKARAKHWHEQQRIRVEPALVADIPVKVNGHANGHAAGDDPPSYTLSQARKEAALAALRQLEFKERSGELIRAIDVEGLITGAMLWAIEAWKRLPRTLRDQLHQVDGSVAQSILELQLEHHVVEFGRHLRRTEDAHELHAQWLAFLEWKQAAGGVKPS
jgi:hypothetical protein